MKRYEMPMPLAGEPWRRITRFCHWKRSRDGKLGDGLAVSVALTGHNR